MSKKIIFGIVILALVFLAIYFISISIHRASMPEESKNLENKKVVLIIAQEGFQDKEFSNTKEVLEKDGANILIASKNVLFPARGKFGLEIMPDIKIEDLKVDEFDAIVFIGGPGAISYIDNEIAHQIARQAVERGKVLGAICIAPEILAKAGVLENVEATVWSNSLDRNPIDVLREEGAIYVDEPVVVSGRIVTANGPEAAGDFGRAIARLLKMTND